jgi:hypothetical protein
LQDITKRCSNFIPYKSNNASGETVKTSCNNPAVIQKKRSTPESQGIEDKKTIRCNCVKSSCMKMYCECFKNGRTCKDCNCVDCCNTEDNENLNVSKLTRLEGSKPEHKHAVKMCTCKRSQCQKGYCECYQNGKQCGKDCRCIDCLNNKPSVLRQLSMNSTQDSPQEPNSVKETLKQMHKRYKDEVKNQE